MQRKRKMPDNTGYFRVVTNQTAGKAEMFLYGYIGQDFWWDEDLQEESLTDLAFLKAFRELEKSYTEIHLRINSPGGSVFHGDPIITAIRNSEATVHTWNDGLAGSMAADIWVAGNVRHMAENAKLMIHSTSSIAFGTAKDMREAADMLDKFDEVAALMLAEATGKTEEEIRAAFYDHSDHWLTAKDAVEWGLISAPEKYTTEPTPTEPEKMNYAALVRSYAKDSVTLSLDEQSKAAIEAFTKASKAMNTQAQDAEETADSDNTTATGGQPEYEQDNTAGEGVTLTVVQALNSVLEKV